MVRDAKGIRRNSRRRLAAKTECTALQGAIRFLAGTPDLRPGLYSVAAARLGLLAKSPDCVYCLRALDVIVSRNQGNSLH